jgi:hypothetical protein
VPTTGRVDATAVSPRVKEGLPKAVRSSVTTSTIETASSPAKRWGCARRGGGVLRPRLRDPWARGDMAGTVA